MSNAKTRGRPKGSTTQIVPVVEHEPTACPACGSIARAKYTNRRELVYDGELIVWRTTRCLVCDQVRRDKHREPLP